MKDKIMKYKACSMLMALLLLIGCGAERTDGNGDGQVDGEEMEWADGTDQNDLFDLPDLPEGCFPEVCNGLDDDCDGEVDEDFDLLGDVLNCGACNFQCSAQGAEPLCIDGTCAIGDCLEGYFDINGSPYDGCEYACSLEVEAESEDDGTCADGLDNDCDGRIDDDDPDCNDCVPEFCNNEDDDCDTLIDEDYDLRTDVLNCGACQNVCAHRPNSDPLCMLGECYIQCLAGYSDLNGDPLDGCEAICEPTADPSEYACDGVDNDCDGEMDEDYVPYLCGQGACETNSVCMRGEEICVPLEPESPTDRLCDGIDNDCDGEVDEEFVAPTCQGACVDGARCQSGTEICGPPAEDPDVTCDGIDGDCDGEADEDYTPYMCGTGVCQNASTCEDGTEECNPGPPRSTEDVSCDDLDDDCDGFVDEDYIPYFCGVGECRNSSNCDNGEEVCTPADPLATDDSVCDGLDEDCDGEVDEEYVPYQCGTGACRRESTCDGGEDNCTPGTPAASDRTCDNVDDDCDGFTDEDYVPYQCGTGLCVTDSVCSGGTATCTPPDPPVGEDQVCDNRDEDCDGSVDEDYRPYTCGLGVCQRDSTCVGGTERCTQGSPTGGETTCNGLDDDCDGPIDEDYVSYTCGTGPCQATSTCVAGEENCEEGTGTPEVCDGVDNDCNGAIDDTFPCRAGQTRSCTTSCGTTGQQTCTSSCTWGTCVPPSETCNGVDDDCDGSCDDGFPCCQGSSGSCTTSCGTTGSRNCSSSCTWGSCTPPAETCNGIDDDCDGGCDETWACCRGSSGSCTTSCSTVGTRTCNSSCAWGSCVPPAETCNGNDDDCDGLCDETWACCRGTTGSCTTSCGSVGTRQCNTSCAWGSCTPPAETCNGIDDDCDGTCDDGWSCCRGSSQSCTTSCGSTGTRTCNTTCAWGSCVPPSETCNGQDDDCDGTCDEGWACCQGATGTCTTSCGSTGTRTCTSSCTWGSCIAPTEVCNGQDDDCDGATDEGFDDAYEPNETCAAANNRGTVADNPAGVVNVSGNIKSPTDVDWYRVSATDDTDTTNDEWDFQVYFTSNPGGLAMDVYRGGCSSTHRCLGVTDCSSWTTDYRSVPTFPYVGEDPCGNSTTLNQCENDTSTFYIRIYRASGSGYCANYSIRIQNNPASNCTGWASPVAGPNYP